MACDCLTQTNALLAEHNTRLPGTIALPHNGVPGYVTVTLLTEKVAPYGKRPVRQAPRRHGADLLPVLRRAVRPLAAVAEEAA